MLLSDDDVSNINDNDNLMNLEKMKDSGLLKPVCRFFKPSVKKSYNLNGKSRNQCKNEIHKSYVFDSIYYSNKKTLGDLNVLDIDDEYKMRSNNILVNLSTNDEITNQSSHMMKHVVKIESNIQIFDGTKSESVNVNLDVGLSEILSNSSAADLILAKNESSDPCNDFQDELSSYSHQLPLKVHEVFSLNIEKLSTDTDETTSEKYFVENFLSSKFEHCAKNNEHCDDNELIQQRTSENLIHQIDSIEIPKILNMEFDRNSIFTSYITEPMFDIRTDNNKMETDSSLLTKQPIIVLEPLNMNKISIGKPKKVCQPRLDLFKSKCLRSSYNVSKNPENSEEVILAEIKNQIAIDHYVSNHVLANQLRMMFPYKKITLKYINFLIDKFNLRAIQRRRKTLDVK